MCLNVGGDLVGLHLLFRMIVCRSALVRLGGIPLLWCVLWLCGALVPRVYVLGYYFLALVERYGFWSCCAGLY